MSKQLSVNTSICSEYQRLLEGSQSALEIWNEHRAEFCQFRFIGREAGDELLRLQSKYARAYTELQNHERNCSPVNWGQEWKHVILKIGRTPSPTTKCARERCPFRGANIEAPWQDPEYPLEILIRRRRIS